MLWMKIESEGLSHYSYLVGDDGEAVVIDPRRDVDAYERALTQAGCRLRYVLETHRNEDYLVGSLELAARTGAEVWHADAELAYGYGQAASPGQEWRVGGLMLSALATPGHTLGHLSYLLHDPDGSPWMVFTGDALFAGGVGRTDLLGESRLEELTRRLYHSLHELLLSLDDGVIVCPAHGHGSACGGSSIADRPWTTIGFERRHNPHLALDEESFVAQNSRMVERPPYFDEVERLNLEGPPLLGRLPQPVPLAPEAFAAIAERAQILDVREIVAFGGAHIPGSLSIHQGGVAGWAGWFLGYQDPLLLVLSGDDPEPLCRQLVRMGFDRFAGYLAGGLHGWYTAGQPISTVETLAVEEARGRWARLSGGWVLDVRAPEELEEEGTIPGAVNIPISEILDRLDEVPTDASILIFCGSGQRSMIVASLLRQRGWEALSVVLGGISGWKAAGAPVREDKTP